MEELLALLGSLPAHNPRYLAIATCLQDGLLPVLPKTAVHQLCAISGVLAIFAVIGAPTAALLVRQAAEAEPASSEASLGMKAKVGGRRQAGEAPAGQYKVQFELGNGDDGRSAKRSPNPRDLPNLGVTFDNLFFSLKILLGRLALFTETEGLPSMASRLYDVDVDATKAELLTEL
ncbi:hypothetical protein JCM5296_005718 [Sporobolomyces johnsonii]